MLLVIILAQYEVEDAPEISSAPQPPKIWLAKLSVHFRGIVLFRFWADLHLTDLVNSQDLQDSKRDLIFPSSVQRFIISDVWHPVDNQSKFL